jgi:hypothetical protein
MVNQGNLDSAKMRAIARHGKFIKKFKREWNAQQVEQVRRETWKAISPEIKERLKEDAPKAVRDLEKRYGG